MKRFLPAVPVLVLLMAFASCNRELDPTAPYLDEVFPVEDGKYRIYHVIDTVYETTSSDLFEARTYYKRELTDGTEQDLLGRNVQKLYIAISPDTMPAYTYNWTHTELWTQFKGDVYAERIEGNTRYLVLRIPPYLGSTWNGNLYNNLDVQTYQYLNLDTTVTVQGTTFEHCVFVLQVPYRKPVQDRGGVFFLEEYAYEIYAPKVGKLVRYSKYYEEQNGDAVPESRVYYEELFTHNY